MAIIGEQFDFFKKYIIANSDNFHPSLVEVLNEIPEGIEGDEATFRFNLKQKDQDNYANLCQEWERVVEQQGFSFYRTYIANNKLLTRDGSVSLREVIQKAPDDICSEAEFEGYITEQNYSEEKLKKLMDDWEDCKANIFLGERAIYSYSITPHLKKYILGEAVEQTPDYYRDKGENEEERINYRNSVLTKEGLLYRDADKIEGHLWNVTPMSDGYFKNLAKRKAHFDQKKGYKKPEKEEEYNAVTKKLAADIKQEMNDSIERVKTEIGPKGMELIRDFIVNEIRNAPNNVILASKTNLKSTLVTISTVFTPNLVTDLMICESLIALAPEYRMESLQDENVKFPEFIEHFIEFATKEILQEILIKKSDKANQSAAGVALGDGSVLRVAFDRAVTGDLANRAKSIFPTANPIQTGSIAFVGFANTLDREGYASDNKIQQLNDMAGFDENSAQAMTKKDGNALSGYIIRESQAAIVIQRAFRKDKERKSTSVDQRTVIKEALLKHKRDQEARRQAESRSNITPSGQEERIPAQTNGQESVSVPAVMQDPLTRLELIELLHNQECIMELSRRKGLEDQGELISRLLKEQGELVSKLLKEKGEEHDRQFALLIETFNKFLDRQAPLPPQGQNVYVERTHDATSHTADHSREEKTARETQMERQMEKMQLETQLAIAELQKNIAESRQNDQTSVDKAASELRHAQELAELNKELETLKKDAQAGASVTPPAAPKRDESIQIPEKGITPTADNSDKNPSVTSSDGTVTPEDKKEGQGDGNQGLDSDGNPLSEQTQSSENPGDSQKRATDNRWPKATNFEELRQLGFIKDGRDENNPLDNRTYTISTIQGDSDAQGMNLLPGQSHIQDGTQMIRHQSGLYEAQYGSETSRYKGLTLFNEHIANIRSSVSNQEIDPDKDVNTLALATIRGTGLKGANAKDEDGKILHSLITSTKSKDGSDRNVTVHFIDDIEYEKIKEQADRAQQEYVKHLYFLKRVKLGKEESLQYLQALRQDDGESLAFDEMQKISNAIGLGSLKISEADYGADDKEYKDLLTAFIEKETADLEEVEETIGLLSGNRQERRQAVARIGNNDVREERDVLNLCLEQLELGNEIHQAIMPDLRAFCLKYLNEDIYADEEVIDNDELKSVIKKCLYQLPNTVSLQEKYRKTVYNYKQIEIERGSIRDSKDPLNFDNLVSDEDVNQSRIYAAQEQKCDVSELTQNELNSRNEDETIIKDGKKVTLRTSEERHSGFNAEDKEGAMKTRFKKNLWNSDKDKRNQACYKNLLDAELPPTPFKGVSYSKSTETPDDLLGDKNAIRNITVIQFKGDSKDHFYAAIPGTQYHIKVTLCKGGIYESAKNGKATLDRGGKNDIYIAENTVMSLDKETGKYIPKSLTDLGLPGRTEEERNFRDSEVKMLKAQMDIFQIKAAYIDPKNPTLSRISTFDGGVVNNNIKTPLTIVKEPSGEQVEDKLKTHHTVISEDPKKANSFLSRMFARGSTEGGRQQ